MRAVCRCSVSAHPRISMFFSENVCAVLKFLCSYLKS
uniref:Uncharacterized protein n=1 Tax=Arundo donax TaxID=35708 RepID=A0A0A9EP25_ARUDO